MGTSAAQGDEGLRLSCASMGMFAIGSGNMCVMCEAGEAMRVDHRVVYAWNCRRDSRAQVWYVLVVVVGQVTQRECWVLVIDLQLLQKEAAV